MTTQKINYSDFITKVDDGSYLAVGDVDNRYDFEPIYTKSYSDAKKYVCHMIAILDAHTLHSIAFMKENNLW